VKVERCRDASLLYDLLGHLQPRTTPLLGAALGHGLGRRTCRATVVRHDDGRAAAVVVLQRWTYGGWTAYPLVLDDSAAALAGDLIDRSAATDLAAFEPDVDAVRPWVTRSRTTITATPAALPPGFAWEDAPPTTRRAGPGDVPRIVDLTWHHAPHAFPNRWLLHRRVRDAVADLTVVVEAGDPAVVAGYAARESSTPEYDFWAQMVVDPAYRGTGLSWRLVAAAIAQTRERGAGGLTFVVASNPMSIPSDAVLDDPYQYVVLAPPRRFSGERRLRHLAVRLVSRRREMPFGEHRTPGRTDRRISDRRTQGTWHTSAGGKAAGR
jgi:GNAT superfamily N-acetyltransferase